MIHGRTPLAILMLVLLLIGVGLAMVYSSSASKASWAKRNALKASNPEAYAEYHSYHDPYYLQRQLVFAALGVGLLLAASAFDHHRLRALSPWILLVCIALLVLVFVPPIGVKVNGSWRWLRLGPFRLQPSEFARLALIIYMARFLDNRQRSMDSLLKTVLPASAIVGIVCGLIIIEPNFSTAAMLGGTVFIFWFIGGMRIVHLGSMAALAALPAILTIQTRPHIQARFRIWYDFIVNGKLSEDQASQSVIAIGSGGLFGLGLGSSIQKYAFLPEAHTDFIFAVMAEELGYVGGCAIVLLYLALVVLGWRVALRAADHFGALLASGVTLLFAIQAAVNLLVAMGAFPPTGQALPFISYGGSSLLANCLGMGILINIAVYSEPGMAAGRRARKPRRRASQKA